MTRLARLAALATAISAFTASAYSAETAPAADDGWIQLFNGKDLTGWTPKIVGHTAGDNFADTFRVKDGMIVVSYDGYDGQFNNRFGHLFYDQPFSNYILRLEYRMVGEQCPGGPEWAFANSGIMLHGQTPESMGKDQFFPVSIEFQLLAGKRGPTGNACSPGTNIVLDGKLYPTHCTNVATQTIPIGEWATAEVEVHGDRLIRQKINGQTVIEYNGTQLDEKDPDAKKLLAAGADKKLTGGTISLQSESHGVQFRNIRLKPLDE
jgi:3-keto-disaccharide hydrolase